MRFVRLVYRFLGFLLLSVIAAIDFIWHKGSASGSELAIYRAQWLHKYARRVLAILNVKLHKSGEFPATPLYVANHLSYLDIFVTAATRPVFFVSKDDVQRWPWGGMLANMAGTLYIKRNVRSDLPRITAEIIEAHEAGIPIVIFPEGNTSDGTEVLPFRAALLQPAVEREWEVTPFHLAYRSSDHANAQGVAWVEDVPFLSHLAGLLQKREIQARVTAAAVQQGVDRKTLAASLRQAVVDLHGDTQAQPQPTEQPAHGA